MTGAGAADVGALARDLFPPEVAVAALRIGEVETGLLPGEEPAVAGAAPRRRQEFIAGRVAARRAMAALGLPAAPVPQGVDRAPLWPPGVVGSISHAGPWCLAAAARSPGVRALGLDIEPDEPLPPDLWGTICSGEELAWLETQPEPARLARLVFSAKECAYKCQYPLTGALCGFDAMRIELDLPASAFRAVLLRPLGSLAPGHRLPGALTREAGLVLTGMTLR